MSLRIFICTLAAFLAMPQSVFAQAAKGKEAPKKEINLTDLGFGEKDTLPDLTLQKTLDDRRFYLKQHQIWGLVAAGAMLATVMSGGEGDLPPEHPFLAGLAVASYGAAAYTSWMAPELASEKKKGGSLWHRRLVWIHLPGMIATPILGYMAAKKIERGEKLDSPEKYHKDVAYVTAGALALSAITVSFEF
jgi:hypothetical protein